MNGSSIDTVISTTRTGPKGAKEADAVKPLITRLYDGSAELVIRIPLKPGKNAVISDNVPLPESIELFAPAPGKDADENERIVNLVSALTKYLLSDVAATKTQNRKAVQAEGISRAKAEGKQMGRPKKEFPDAYYDAINLCRAGKISISEGAERSGMTYWAFYANLRRNNHAETES